MKKKNKKINSPKSFLISDLETVTLKIIDEFETRPTMPTDIVTFLYLEKEQIKHNILKDLKKEVEK